jgi:hypothetical protein
MKERCLTVPWWNLSGRQPGPISASRSPDYNDSFRGVHLNKAGSVRGNLKMLYGKEAGAAATTWSP